VITTWVIQKLWPHLDYTKQSSRLWPHLGSYWTTTKTWVIQKNCDHTWITLNKSCRLWPYLWSYWTPTTPWSYWQSPRLWPQLGSYWQSPRLWPQLGSYCNCYHTWVILGSPLNCITVDTHMGQTKLLITSAYTRLTDWTVYHTFNFTWNLDARPKLWYLGFL